MGFKLVNKNNHVVSAYVLKDGYSRNVSPFGFISLGSLTANEISIYKKYAAVGLVLETEETSQPVSGRKASETMQKPVVQDKTAPTVQNKTEQASASEEKVETSTEKKDTVAVKEVAVAVKKDVEDESKPPSVEKNIDDMNASELKAKAVELGVDMTGMRKKSELRAALKKKLGLPD